MARARLLHASGNGDRWYLVRGPEPDRVFVRHEPNAGSGDVASEVRIADFLVRAVYGPGHRALLRLIEGLVEGGASA